MKHWIHLSITALLLTGCSGLFTETSDTGSPSSQAAPLTPSSQPASLRAQCARPFSYLWNVASARPLDHSAAPAIEDGRMVTLYQHLFGLYPCIDCNERSGENVHLSHGGVPQAMLDNNGALLAQHLATFENDLLAAGVAPDYDGYIGIDYESWWPLWALNHPSWAGGYRQVSIDRAAGHCLGCTEQQIYLLAVAEFEEGARIFLERTVEHIQELRPLAKIGYYAYPIAPYHFGYHDTTLIPTLAFPLDSDAVMLGYCPVGTLQGDCYRLLNDRLQWLWDVQTAFFPSLYQYYPSANPPGLWQANLEDNRLYVDGAVVESVRVANGEPILPYIWYRYHDSNAGYGMDFLNHDDMSVTVNQIYDSGAAGVVIWAADVTPDEMSAAENYVDSTLGPIINALEAERCP